MKKAVLFLFVMAALITASGCTISSGVALGSVEDNSSNKLSMTYEKFSGYKQTHIQVKDTPVTVDIEIETEEGTLDAYIALDNDKENAGYEGHDIKTSSFTVTLHEKGDYTLRVDADDHSGSYSFIWE